MYSFVIPLYQMYSDHMTSGITQVIFYYVACDDGMRHIFSSPSAAVVLSL